MQPSRKIASNIFKGSLGNMIEWYDWYVYAAFAVYFSPSFFPSHDPTSELLDAAAVFALGFLMRPIGSLVMGRYADRHGRRAGLTLSILIMASGSLLIALLPNYQTVGIWAPVLLVVIRLFQGLSLGGEYGTSATYLSEMAEPSRRGFYSSFQYVTLVSGQLIALGVQIILQMYLTETELSFWVGASHLPSVQPVLYSFSGCDYRWTSQTSFSTCPPVNANQLARYAPYLSIPSKS